MGGRWMSADEAIARLERQVDDRWVPCCGRHLAEWNAKGRPVGADLHHPTHDHEKEKQPA